MDPGNRNPTAKQKCSKAKPYSRMQDTRLESGDIAGVTADPGSEKALHPFLGDTKVLRARN